MPLPIYALHNAYALLVASRMSSIRAKCTATRNWMIQAKPGIQAFNPFIEG